MPNCRTSRPASWDTVSVGITASRAGPYITHTALLTQHSSHNTLTQHPHIVLLTQHPHTALLTQHPHTAPSHCTLTQHPCTRSCLSRCRVTVPLSEACVSAPCRSGASQFCLGVLPGCPASPPVPGAVHTTATHVQSMAAGEWGVGCVEEGLVWRVRCGGEGLVWRVRCGGRA